MIASCDSWCVADVFKFYISLATSRSCVVLRWHLLATVFRSLGEARYLDVLTLGLGFSK